MNLAKNTKTEKNSNIFKKFITDDYDYNNLSDEELNFLIGFFKSRSKTLGFIRRADFYLGDFPLVNRNFTSLKNLHFVVIKFFNDNNEEFFRCFLKDNNNNKNFSALGFFVDED